MISPSSPALTLPPASRQALDGKTLEFHLELDYANDRHPVAGSGTLCIADREVLLRTATPAGPGGRVLYLVLTREQVGLIQRHPTREFDLIADQAPSPLRGSAGLQNRGRTRARTRAAKPARTAPARMQAGRRAVPAPA